ncbi:MAG: hypothetical protein FD126_2443 [Elusimicrobia bacterium]|nr:MAG: hypothetical protein FD126_2443 [Elusimicrobiota bacterium]
MTTPTPLPRACARLLALLAVVSVFNAPPVSAAKRKAAGAKQEAVVEWVKVEYTHNGKPYTYYYPKNKPYTNDGGHERINLYKEPRLEDAFMARSHLFRDPGAAKNAPFKLHLISESEAGAASRSSLCPLPPFPPPLRPRLRSRPSRLPSARRPPTPPWVCPCASRTLPATSRTGLS